MNAKIFSYTYWFYPAQCCFSAQGRIRVQVVFDDIDNTSRNLAKRAKRVLLAKVGVTEETLGPRKSGLTQEQVSVWHVSVFNLSCDHSH